MIQRIQRKQQLYRGQRSLVAIAHTCALAFARMRRDSLRTPRCVSRVLATRCAAARRPTRDSLNSLDSYPVSQNPFLEGAAFLKCMLFSGPPYPDKTWTTEVLNAPIMAIWRKSPHHMAISSICFYGVLVKPLTPHIPMWMIQTTSSLHSVQTWIILWMAMVVAIQTSIIFALIRVHISTSSTTSIFSAQYTRALPTSVRGLLMENISGFLRSVMWTFRCLIRMASAILFNSKMLCMLLLSIQTSYRSAAFGKTVESKPDLETGTSLNYEMV